MMVIDIITVFPEILKGPLDHSIVQRAQDKGLAKIRIHNLRDFATDKYNSVDDYAFGGGAGMVLKIEPVFKAIEALKKDTQKIDEIIYTTPDGVPFNQKVANTLSSCSRLVILCGHYKGIDQRIRDHLITRELSVGDYVLSGGELAAAIISDAVIRLIPGVLSDETSALTDTFQDGLLAPPVYTRPSNFKGWKVPPVLLSGDEKKISHWRLEKSIEKTRSCRPDLWANDEGT